MDKIRIVFIVGTLVIGGTERQLIEFLRRVNRQQFECKVLSFQCSGKLRREIEKLDIPFTCLDFQATQGIFSPGSYVRMYRLMQAMVRYLSQEQPQIVQSYLDWANILGTIAAKIAGVPVIITGRRVSTEPAYAQYDLSAKFYYRWLLNLTNCWVTAIVANSEVVKQQCLQCEKGVTDSKILVIYNGLDPDQDQNQAASDTLKKVLHIPPHHHIVGIIANLHPRKGHGDFLKAAAIVRQKKPETVFLIVGRDEGMQATLEALAEELGIRSAVIFTGERDDIPDLLALFDVQVSASYSEGLSNAILEGMAMQNPLVATSVGGNPELIVDQESGLLVPPGDAGCLADRILRLLDDRELRERLGRQARRRVETHFQMTQMIRNTEALYLRVLPNTRSQG